MNIHVNDAKKLLYSFYNKHKDLVEATYLISGTLDGSTDLKIKITKDINDKEKFDQIQSIQIYSLSPQNIQFDEIVTTVNSQLKKYTVDAEKLAKWGVIKGPELVKIEQVAAPAPQRSNQQSAVAVKKSDKEPVPVSKKKEFPDMGLRSAQILNRNRKTEDEKPKARTSTQPTFGSSSKQAKSKPERSKTEPATKVVKPVEESKKASAARLEKEKKQKELESMFDDDDDDLMIEEGAPVDTNDKEIETTEKVSKKTEDLEGIFDSSFSQTQSQPSNKNEVEAVPEEPELVEEEVIEEESQDKKETPETTSYYDEDGYLVTKVAEKPKSKPKPKPRARASPAPASTPTTKKAKTSGPKQQSSLMSFFGKK